MNPLSSNQNRFLPVLVAFLLLSPLARATTFNVSVGTGGGRNFTPSTVNIATGDTVLWTWDGNFHSVTSGTAPNPDGLFDSGVNNTGATFSFTFPNAGSFPYFCTVHGAMMSGTVNVASASPTPSPAAVVEVGPKSDPFGFVPPTVSIQTGETVEWDWFSDSHTVSSGTAPDPDGLFESDIQNTGFVFFYTFNTPGSYPYFCQVHGKMMSGTINVGSGLSISGGVQNCSPPVPTSVSGVTMTLTGTSSSTSTTNGAGIYSFSGLTSGGNYTVTPSKAALVPGTSSINTTDVLAIQRHFLAIAIIPPGCRLTAADTTESGSINTQDVLAVQRFFLAVAGGTAGTGQYRFTPTNQSYSPLNTTQTGQNYTTLVLGDVAAPFQ